MARGRQEGADPEGGGRRRWQKLTGRSFLRTAQVATSRVVGMLEKRDILRKQQTYAGKVQVCELGWRVWFQRRSMDANFVARIWWWGSASTTVSKRHVDPRPNFIDNMAEEEEQLRDAVRRCRARACGWQA